MTTNSNIARLGLCQHACGLDKAANVALACEQIREAAARGARVIATQELFASRYFPQTEDERHFELAEPIPGPTTETLCRLAQELGVFITASLFEKRTAGIFHNTSILADPNGMIVDKYRKMHVPDDPRFFEKYYFTPGDLGFRAQHAGGVSTGMLICWDQWYPEAARLTAMRGAQVLFYPTAIGWYHGETEKDKRDQRDAWITVQRAHAIANGVFVAAVNRVGTEGDLLFWGGSFVCDPSGAILAEAGPTEETVLVVDCDLSRIDSVRQGWPFFRDRRIDAYGQITERFLDS